jgi:hypothetical protein
MTRAEYWDGDEWRDLLDDVLDGVIAPDKPRPCHPDATDQVDALIYNIHLVTRNMRELCALRPEQAERYQEQYRQVTDKLAAELVTVIGPGRARMHVVRPGKMQCDECG